MKSKLSRSLGQHQMLVYSVFLHLFAFSIVLFMPKTQATPKKIVPVVLVELMDVAAPVPKAKPVPAQPPAKTHSASVPQKRKAPQPKAKPAATKKSRLKTDIQELEKLAKLPPRRTAPAKVRKNPLMNKTFQDLERLKIKSRPKPKPLEPISKEKILDETLRELEELKSKKPVDVVSLKPVRKKFNFDKQFEELEALKTPKLPKSSPIPAAAQETPSQDSETPTPESAPKKERPEVQENLAPSNATQDLVKALEQLADENVQDAVPQKPREDPLAKLRLSEISGLGNLEPIIKKLEGLKSSPGPAAIEIKSETVQSRKFSSTLRKLEVVAIQDDRGRPQAVAKTASLQNAARTTSPKLAEGIPTDDVLSLYIGAVKQKIDSKWKSPLGAKPGEEVLISFYIYPKGNIDEPVVQKHSIQPQLDNLAVRAILEASPFDKFPNELKKANLQITIRFDYVPETKP